MTRVLLVISIAAAAGCRNPRGSPEVGSLDAPLADAAAIDASASDAAAIDAAASDAAAIDARPVDARPVDARPVDARPVDASADAQACPLLTVVFGIPPPNPEIVMSLVQPYPGGKVELYNAGDSDVDVTGLELYWPPAPAHGPLSGIVKAHGYRSFDWPFEDLSGGGELGLEVGTDWYNTIDYICWQTDPYPTDQDTGRSYNGEVQGIGWSGTCSTQLTGTGIARKDDRTGQSGTDYDSTSTRAPRNCP